MLKNEKFICGTVEECVNEIFKMIDWNKMEFPDFDFCSDGFFEDLTQEELDEAENITYLGTGCYGCKRNSDFDSLRESIDLIFGYYGGGWFRSMCLDDDEYEDEYKKEMISIICEGADLRPEWYTAFELIKKGE